MQRLNSIQNWKDCEKWTNNSFQWSKTCPLHKESECVSSRELITLFAHTIFLQQTALITSGQKCKNLCKRIYYYLFKLKTLWLKEKLLHLSNFFFSHNVFKSCLLQRRQKASICVKGLRTPSRIEQRCRQLRQTL